MIIIPAIDIYDDKIVRLTKGSFDNITYYKNSPLQQAKLYESSGFNIIHVVDLEGSKTGKISAAKTIKELKEETDLKIQFGGGIRDMKVATQLFETGVDYAVIGSLAVKNKNEFKLVVEKFSPGRIVISADVKDEKVFISGWTEETSISITDHIKNCKSLGIEIFLCTDISKDGTLNGPNIDLYKKILNEFPDIKLIASGGVKDMEDIKKLNSLNLYAVVVGKAIYEGIIDIKELRDFALPQNNSMS